MALLRITDAESVKKGTSRNREDKAKTKEKPKNQKTKPTKNQRTERKRRNENKSHHSRRTQSPAKLFSLSEDDPMHFQINLFDSFH
jgi:hypothetical protein